MTGLMMLLNVKAEAQEPVEEAFIDPEKEDNAVLIERYDLLYVCVVLSGLAEQTNVTQLAMPAHIPHRAGKGGPFTSCKLPGLTNQLTDFEHRLPGSIQYQWLQT